MGCRDYLGKHKWALGRVKEKLGQLHYEVLLDDGRVWRRHVDQMRAIGENTEPRENKQVDADFYGPPPGCETQERPLGTKVETKM